MIDPEKRRRARYVLLVVSLAALTFMTLDYRNVGVIESLKDSFGGASNSSDGVFSTLTSPFRNLWHGLTEWDKVKDEEQELRKQVDDLTGQLAQQRIDDTNYRKLVDAQKLVLTGDIDSIMARRTSGTLSNFEPNTIYLDKGAEAGITEGMPVVNGAGVVGVVARANRGRSIVRLITDPTLRFRVVLLASGAVAVGHGQGPLEQWLLEDGIDIGLQVVKGEDVVTVSAEQALFPADLPVGKVVASRADAAQSELVLEVKPLVDFENLDFVRVLKWTPQRQAAAVSGLDTDPVVPDDIVPPTASTRPPDEGSATAGAEGENG